MRQGFSYKVKPVENKVHFCRSCKGTHFYTEGENVICINCETLYSQPSKNELNHLLREDQICSKNHTDSLLSHYNVMKTFKQFCRKK